MERFTQEVQIRQQSDVICFLAPAGMGKTCLLKHVRRQLQQRNWLCGYSEASSDATTAIMDLLSDARDALPAEGMGARFLSHLQNVSISAGPVGIGLSLEGAGESTAYLRLSDLLRRLGALAKQNNVGVSLIIDEAQVLPQQDLETLFRVINRLDDLPIAAIIAGLPKIPSKLLYGENTCPEIWYQPLYPLTRSEAKVALATPVIDDGGSFTVDALDLLAGFAEGHPLTLQKVGSTAWLEADRAIADGQPLVIQREHAAAAIDSVQSQFEVSIYRPVWAKCEQAGRAVLRALAQEQAMSRVPLEARALEMLGQEGTPLLIQETIHALEGDGIIYRPGTGWERANRIARITVPGFADFIRAQSV